MRYFGVWTAMNNAADQDCDMSFAAEIIMNSFEGTYAIQENKLNKKTVIPQEYKWLP
jgi:hypothetical protein